MTADPIVYDAIKHKHPSLCSACIHKQGDAVQMLTGYCLMACRCDGCQRSADLAMCVISKPLIPLENPFSRNRTMSYTVKINASGGYSIVNGCETVADYHTKRDAQLGAAAPELLRALKLLWGYVEDLRTTNPGYLGKLGLQDYARFNEAMGATPAAIALAEKGN